MALQKTVVAISLKSGLDTKNDPKQVIPGKLLKLENGIFSEGMQIRKRNGNAALGSFIEGSTASLTVGTALATYNKELVLFTGNELYSYSNSTQRWTDKGSATNVGLSVDPVIRNTYQQTTPDSAYHSTGLQLFAWEDSRGGSRYSIVDASTGQQIVTDILISATATKPKPFAIGNFIIIIYLDTSNKHLKYIAIPSSTPTSPQAAVDLATNCNVTNPNFDATLQGDRVFFAYNNSDGGNGITVKYINSFLTQSAGRDVTGESGSVCLSIFADSVKQQIWVAYYNGTNVKYFIRDYSLSSTAVLAPTAVETLGTIDNICGIASNGTATLFYAVHAATTYNEYVKSCSLTFTGTVGTPAVMLRSVGLASKAFTFNGINYVTVAFESPLQPTYFLVNASGQIVGKFCPSVGGGLAKKNVLPEVNKLSTTEFSLACLQKDLLTTISGNVYTVTGVEACTFTFNSNNSLLKAQLGENLHLTGACLTMYDGGGSTVEHGFHVFPEGVTDVITGSGGSIAIGTYQYAVVAEWPDARGQVHYSAPSIGLSVAIVANSSQVALTIPTLRLTSKVAPRGSVTFGIYRTQSNGTTFFRLNSVTSPLANDTTTDTVSYTDTQADAAIIGNPILYTTGGVLENIAAPASNLITTFKNRVILVPSENPLSFWPSKKVVPGAPVEFSDFLVQNVDPRGGDITAIAPLDSELILFKETSIFYVIGDGPNSTGANNDYSEAQLITTDTGCTNPRSVVVTPGGLMYQSQKGIYLLPRGLGIPTYIGADVQAYNKATVVSATLIDNTNQVRFCLDTGVALVYDYLEGQWSVFTNHNAVDATIFQGQFTFLKPNGIVWQETPGVFTDDGAFIKLKLLTSWLSFAGLQAFQRVYKLLILGEYVSPHKLLVQIAYDFNPNSIQEDYIDATSIFQAGTYGSDATYGSGTTYGGPDQNYQFRVDMTQQKCQTIQFSIEDIQSSAFGEGLSLSALTFEVGQKQGTFKLPATRIVG